MLQFLFFFFFFSILLFIFVFSLFFSKFRFISTNFSCNKSKSDIFSITYESIYIFQDYTIFFFDIKRILAKGQQKYVKKKNPTCHHYIPLFCLSLSSNPIFTVSDLPVQSKMLPIHTNSQPYTDSHT